RKAERRVDHAPRQQEQYEQNGQAIGVGNVAENIELEHTENGTDDDTLKAVGAAGDVRYLVGDLAHDERHAERHHQPREVGSAQNEKARRKSEHGRANAGLNKREHRRVDDTVLGQQRGQIGTQTEEGRVSQRYDAGIAENEIEREREQGKPSGLGEDQMPPRHQEEAGQRRQPEGVFERTPAGASRQTAANLCDQRGSHSYLTAARANRPCGGKIRRTIMMVYITTATNFGKKYLRATSAVPIKSEAAKGPVMLEVRPTVTTIRK